MMFHEFNVCLGLARGVDGVIWVDLLGGLEFIDARGKGKGKGKGGFEVFNGWLCGLLDVDECCIDEERKEEVGARVRGKELMVVWYTVFESLLGNGVGRVDLVDLVKAMTSFSGLEADFYELNAFEGLLGMDDMISVFGGYMFDSEAQVAPNLLRERLFAGFSLEKLLSVSGESQTRQFLTQSPQGEFNLADTKAYLSDFMHELVSKVYNEKFGQISERFFVSESPQGKPTFDFNLINRFEDQKALIENFESKFGQFQDKNSTEKIGLEKLISKQWIDYYNRFFQEVSVLCDLKGIWVDFLDILKPDFHSISKIYSELTIGIQQFTEVYHRIQGVTSGDLADASLLEKSMSKDDILKKLKERVLSRLEEFKSHLTENIVNASPEHRHQGLRDIFVAFVIFEKFCATSDSYQNGQDESSINVNVN